MPSSKTGGVLRKLKEMRVLLRAIDRSPRATLAVLIGAYFVVIGSVVVLQHYQYKTQGWDLGIFNQLFWNTLHGRFMQTSVEDTPLHLGRHMSPGLLFLLPGYALFPSPYFLLIVQTIALALGAWPLYLLARRKLHDTRHSLLIAAAYLLYPSLHSINLYDFHEIAFLPPLLIAGWYFFETRTWGWMAACLILGASMREDAALMIGIAGLAMMFRFSREDAPGTRNTDRRAGLLVAACAFTWFAVSVLALMPALGGGLYNLDRYAELGDTSSEIFRTLLTRPDRVIATIASFPKFAYTILILAPVALLPLLSLRGLILILPGILENTLVNYPLQFSTIYHYDAVLVGGVFIGTVYGLAAVRMRRIGSPRLWSIALLILALTNFAVRSKLSPLQLPYTVRGDNQTREAWEALISRIPPGASVAANTHVVPHLANRPTLFRFGEEPYRTDVALVDTKNWVLFPSRAAFETHLARYLLTDDYRTDLIQRRYLLLIRKELP